MWPLRAAKWTTRRRRRHGSIPRLTRLPLRRAERTHAPTLPASTHPPTPDPRPSLTSKVDRSCSKVAGSRSKVVGPSKVADPGSRTPPRPSSDATTPP
eukprot:CAMPEP_0180312504 /NCGR_PEP_ID=MMETSP0988-20121125/30848_1 /TAXON_ID=697907 /ORGANISM="non described non described, Strain CCMP2293" /LENGTH=97 /DNA_ID=CAMNT_0022296715 /DNA_START=461 /DNA_END=750 /DNA_ORIENTATION=+